MIIQSPIKYSRPGFQQILEEGEELVMVERFRELILPVLVGGQWAELRSLRLNGYGVGEDEEMMERVSRACP